jgi:hypothetical protein
MTATKWVPKIILALVVAVVLTLVLAVVVSLYGMSVSSG